jgi:hypothetical protein
MLQDYFQNVEVEFFYLRIAKKFVIENYHLIYNFCRRKYLAILSLNAPAPEQLIVRVPYGGKYEISNTQWCKAEDAAKHVAIAVIMRHNQ